MLPANRELRLVAGVVVFLKGLNLQTNSQRVERNLLTKRLFGRKNASNFQQVFLIFISNQGSGSRGHRRSSRLAKAVAYASESSPDTDDEYDAMEDPYTHDDQVVAENLQRLFDAEADDVAAEEVRPPPGAGITIGGSTRTSGAPLRFSWTPAGAPPARPPSKSIRPRHTVFTSIHDTSLLTNLINHLLTSIRCCEEPNPKSSSRDGWLDFHKLLAVARQEYRDFLTELGFGPFLSIPYMFLSHLLVRCWVERASPSQRISGLKAMAILGPSDLEACRGTTNIVLRVRYLRQLLEEEREEPPTELRYRQWITNFIFNCFLGDDQTTVLTPIVVMFRDVNALREFDWGALTYGFYIWGLRLFSHRETSSFLGFWQFTIFWEFEHFHSFHPSRLQSAPDPTFPLARRWDSTRIERLTVRTLLECLTTIDCIRDKDVIFQPYSSALVEHTELGLDVVIPVDPPPSMTIEDYIPATPSDAYLEGVDYLPDLVRGEMPYREWFALNTLGSLMVVHEVEGGQVLGGVAQDSFQLQFSREVERLQGEVLCLQLELLVTEDRASSSSRGRTSPSSLPPPTSGLVLRS
uniref:Aminotransferase-like plant mobile domain-containing protein n=1 Tax=Fagus sylvatica TaxID=28930 RepID=A0A2N9EQA0_FAGSY